MMATDEPLEGAALEAAVSRVMAQHDALGSAPSAVRRAGGR